MVEVFPGIFQVTEGASRGVMRPPVNIFIITGPEGLVFDGGYGTRKDVQYFTEKFREVQKECLARGVPFNVTRIMPSHAHPDHFSGLVSLRKKLGLSIILTKSMHDILASREAYRSSYNVEGHIPSKIRNPVVERVSKATLGRIWSFFYEKAYGTDFIPDPDRIIDNQGYIDINGRPWRIIHSPGHSEDHISLYNPGTGVLFAGDNILRSVTTWLGPPKSDLEAYIASLKYIRDLPGLSLILGAHGSPIVNPRERIGEILQWRDERTRQVLDLIRTCGASGVTLREMLDRLYQKKSWFTYRIAEGWILVTLEYLEKQGLVTHRIAGRKVLFTGL